MNQLASTEKLVKEYIDSGKALKQKFDELKFGKIIKRMEMEERFKPITESVRSLKTNLSTLPHTSSSSTENEFLYHGSSRKPDKTFGLYTKGKTLYIGNSPVTVTYDNTLILETDSSTYNITQGLLELLLYMEPENYTEKDLEDYEDILLKTFAYKRNNDSTSDFNKTSRSYKYKSIIKPFLIKQKLMKNSKTKEPVDNDNDYDGSVFKGKGLRKFNTGKPVEYVHWNTIDELLERLCHLWGEVQAGNTNPLLLNEIVNIIQEFKEL